MRVSGAKFTSPQTGGYHGGKCFQLLGRICPQVDFCALQACVPEPQRELSDVAGRLKRMHSATVPQDVRRDSLSGDRGPGLRYSCYMLGQDVLKPGPRHGPTGCVQEQLRIPIDWTRLQPFRNGGRCFFPQG